MVASSIARIAKGFGIAAGSLAGVVGAANAIRVVTEKRQIGKVRNLADPQEAEHLGEMAYDRRYTVVAGDGVPLEVGEVGPKDAPMTVVFAHGFANSAGSFYFQRRDLARMRSPRIRMVFYDQRGHGASGIGDRQGSTIDQLGADLRDVIATAAGSEPVVLVGHSMGGMTIMALADIEPAWFGSRIRGVALLSTAADNVMANAIGKLPKPLVQRAIQLSVKGAQAAPRLVEAGRRQLDRTLWLANLRYAFGSNGAPATLSDYVDRMIEETPIAVLAAFYDALSGHDKVAALHALRHCDVLVLTGDEDRLVPLVHSEVLAREIPDAELFIVPGAGHMAHMEMPQIIDARLRKFIRRVYEQAVQTPARTRA